MSEKSTGAACPKAPTGQASQSEDTFDIVLIQPSVIWVYDPFEHIGLAYLAAALRQHGFRVKIIDAVLEHLTFADLYRRLAALRYSVLGVTMISHGYRSTVRFLSYVKQKHPSVKIVGGGHFATFAAAKIMADTEVFDAIALGEAELNFVDYCQREILGRDMPVGGFLFKDGTRLPTHHLGSFEQLPFPSRDMLPLAFERGAQMSVTSSRGCYARCTFCTVHSFYQRSDGRRWFGRDINNIIEELTVLHETYGISHFNFVDDNFVSAGKAGRQRVIDFAEAYGASGLPMTFHIDCRANDVREEQIAALYDTGLTSVFMGIESVHKQDLIDYRKGLKVEVNWRAVEILKKFNLKYTLSMIMFNPRTTREAILENVQYLKEVEFFPRNPISILNIYEGTDLLKIYKDFVSGPFWNYRFRFELEEISEIYEIILDFCKDTLPLERLLSLRGRVGADLRQQLYEIRLFALGDLAEHYNAKSTTEIFAPWQARLEALRHTSPVDAARSADAASYRRERLYLQGDVERQHVAASGSVKLIHG